jgi:hypothetical protein
MQQANLCSILGSAILFILYILSSLPPLLIYRVP